MNALILTIYNKPSPMPVLDIHPLIHFPYSFHHKGNSSPFQVPVVSLNLLLMKPFFKENLMQGTGNPSDGAAEYQSGDNKRTQRLATAGSQYHTQARDPKGRGVVLETRGRVTSRGSYLVRAEAKEEA